MNYQHQILGTIIASVLNYDQLCKEMTQNPAIDNASSSYAPCDGRDIKGSQLEIRTNHSITNTPDLRGKFLRCLNVIYSVGQPLPFDPKQDGDPESNRVVMDYQKDGFTSHSHPAQSSGGFAHNGGPGMGMQSNNGQQFEFLAPNITTSAVGINETRPRNVSVYYYIKIN